MYLPPLQPLNRNDNCISGDIVIHPSAAIAPGVVLQAAPDSRIIIGQGVCIGMGAILNAYQGTIEIKNGAVIGAGVLIIGKSTVGDRACIGIATTIFNADINSLAVIAAGTIIGDTSRQISIDSVALENNSKTPDLQTPEIPSSEPETETITEEVEEPEIILEQESEKEEETAIEDNNKTAEITQKSENTAIFGKLYVNQLLVNLFPQGQNLNSPPTEEK